MVHDGYTNDDYQQYVKSSDDCDFHHGKRSNLMVSDVLVIIRRANVNGILMTAPGRRNY